MSPEFMARLEHAWVDWLRPVSIIVLFAFGAVLHWAGVIGENTTATLMVVAILGGFIVWGSAPAWRAATKPLHRGLVVLLAGTALIAMGFPTLRVAQPGKVLADATLTREKTSAKLELGDEGPYYVTVSGGFTPGGTSEVTAPYRLTAEDGSASTLIDGRLQRSLVHMRARRGGSTGTAVPSDHTENAHLVSVKGPAVTFTATTAVDRQLVGGLHLAVRSAGPNPYLFLGLGLLDLGLALALDVMLRDQRGGARSYLTALIGVAFAFSLTYPMAATPSVLVRPAIGAGIVSILAGLLGGVGISTVARTFAVRRAGPQDGTSAPARRKPAHASR